MPKYKFSARNLARALIDGNLRAANPIDLASKLAENGLLLESFVLTSPLLFERFRAWMHKTEITHITRQMAVLVSSDVPVLETLESIRDQTADKGLRVIFDNIKEAIEAGQSMSNAFGNYSAYFDQMYISLLRCGEVSGTLNITLDRIAGYREKAGHFRKKVKAALAYPALVILVSIAVIMALIGYVVPLFSGMYSGFGLELPYSTRKMIAVGEILKGVVWFIPFGLLGFIMTIAGISRKERFRMLVGRLLLKLPALKGLSTKLVTARFSRTLATMLKSGVQLVDAVSVASSTTGNKYAEEILNDIPDRLAQGVSLSQAIADFEIFPGTLVRMIRAGESTGRLGDMFAKVADLYESDIDTEIAAVTSIIEPIIMLGLGTIVAFILIVMYLPLFDLVGQIGP